MNEWEIIDKVIPTLHRVYIWGAPGIGKTHYGNDLAKKHNLPPFSINFNEDQMAQEHMGHYIPRGSEFTWHDGPIARAMQTGVLIANELPRASTAIGDLMLNVLDDRELATIVTPAGTIIKPHEKFFCIVTGNDSPTASGMDPALIDRMDLIVNITEVHPNLVTRLNAMVDGLGNVVAASYANDGRAHFGTRSALSFGKLVQGKVFPTLEDAAKVIWRESALDFLTLLKTFSPSPTPAESAIVKPVKTLTIS